MSNGRTQIIEAPQLPPARREGGALAAQSNALAARSVEEVKMAIMLAREFPRNPDQARAEMVLNCKVPAFAMKAVYEYERGKAKIEGASVVFMRELAKTWTNFRSGGTILGDTHDTRTVRAYAWDLERNVYKEQDLTFKKLVQRRDGWAEPDERDLTILTNAMIGKTERNVIGHVLPWVMVQELLDHCKHTRHSKIKEDPDGFRRHLLDGFAAAKVSPDDLKLITGLESDHWNVTVMEYLHGKLLSLQEQESTLQDWLEQLSIDKKVRGDRPPQTPAEYRERILAKAGAEKATREAAEQQRPADVPPAEQQPAKPTKKRTATNAASQETTGQQEPERN